MCHRNRIGINPGGDQARDMGHVDKQVGADLVCDRAKALPIDHARIRAESGHNHLRLVFQRQALHLLVIDLAGFIVNAVLDGIK